MIIQIYEIQTPTEAQMMIDAGVDHIGSVILSADRWKDATLLQTVNRVRSSGSQSSLIPLFSEPDTVFRVIEYYQPNIIHFCDELTTRNIPRRVRLQEEVILKFPDIKIMRSIPLPRDNSKEKHRQWVKAARPFEATTDYFLTDTWMETEGSVQPVEGFVGITGMTCDWNLAAQLVESTTVPVILAGGLDPDNVIDGVMQVNPYGVDSCTGTNAVDAQGRSIRFQKDPVKVKRFVEAVRNYEKKVL